jgi:hypothetical protein
MDEGPREINGVPLYTRSGTLRKRYSVDERLQMAGATPTHLETFVKWLCPYAPPFAITKSGSDDPRAWVTAKGKLCTKHVVRHLLGDAIPGIPAKWVAPWGAMYTRWIGLDIDFRGDQEDFRRRVAVAEQAMATLGYPKSGPLWSPTPSGGLHVRGFLAKTMFTYQVEVLFDNLGITHSPGQIEVFPREDRGLRLPFGKIPEQPFDPTAWVRFVKALGRKQGVCRLDPYEMLKQSESQLALRLEREMRREEPAPAPTASVAPAALEDAVLPVHRPTEVADHPPATPAKITCRADAEAMYKRGIWRPGMRVDATKQLAWHFLKAQGKSIEETIELLTRWCYDTGRTTSVTVQQDLANGTSEVADQVEEIVRSIASFPTTGRVRPPDGVYREEVEWIVLRLKACGDFERDVAFACQMLKFAKRCGQKGEESWTAMVAVAKVMRTWPRFTGRRYLAPRKALQEHGVIVMLKEKVQTPNKTGRPRTWGILVPPRMDANAIERGELPMGIEEAVAYALEVKEEAETQRNSCPNASPPASNDSCRAIGLDGTLLFPDESGESEQGANGFEKGSMGPKEAIPFTAPAFEPVVSEPDAVSWNPTPDNGHDDNIEDEVNYDGVEEDDIDYDRLKDFEETRSSKYLWADYTKDYRPRRDHW